MLRYVKRNTDRTYFERPDGMPAALHRLLIERGIASAAEAEAFLRPGPDSLHDPFLLSGMDAAVARVRAAVAAGAPMCVYGDYDVDGVCAASILKLYLERQGARTEVYLPSRHSEGYGLNEAAVRAIAARAKLLITVDCGVTSVALVDLAKSLGLDVIVTDHHRPAETEDGFCLPDCPVVNPLLGDYPFPYLCGAGVAWKLAWALAGEPPMDLVDIAALATVADVVSLTGENRAIVRMGLDSINKGARPGVAALIQAAGLEGKPVTSTAIAFQLAPRLNAGGRLGSATRALELVTARDAAAAMPLAEALEQENALRRQVEQRILAEAEAQLRGFDFIRHRAIILAGADWNPGVIGLAASRLVERYHYPVILLAGSGGRLTGSCRSIEGVDIHAALTGCAAHLVKFGGHRQAAGLTVERDKLTGFIAAMDAYLEANVAPDAYIPFQAYDTELDLEAVTPGLIAALEGVQPTGFGNPAPVFRARAEVIEARTVGADGAHLKLTLSQNNHRLGGIAFREGGQAGRLSESGEDCRVDVLFVPKLNTYMGRTTAQLEVRALSDADANARIASKLDAEPALQCDFLTEILYNSKIDLSAAPEARDIEMADAAALSADSPQGTLYLVSDLAAASRLMAWLTPQPDLCFGRLPEEPRAFNAVCVCPAMPAIPPAYRRVVLFGTPAEYLIGRLPPGAEAYRLREHPAWMRCLPDIDEMRRVYRALMALSRRPVRFRSLTQLARLAREASETELTAALAAILAIADMGLFDIRLGDDPPRIVRLNRRKAEPEASAVWRAVQRWRSGEL